MHKSVSVSVSASVFVLACDSLCMFNKHTLLERRQGKWKEILWCRSIPWAKKLFRTAFILTVASNVTHALVYEILFQQANMQEERKIQRKKKLFCMKFSILFFFTFKIFHFVFSVDSLVFLFAHSLFLFSFDFDVRLRTSVRSKYIFREEGSTDRYYIYRCICVCIV